MAQWNPQVNELFLKASEIPLPEERRAFLDEACAGDADLRAKAEAMLKAGEQAGSFLEAPAAGFAETLDQPHSEAPGTVIGPYKLLEQIGEGGFGVVYLAEQTAPVRRRVALKILKPGMDTRQIVARFEAERQALAIMDHPNIAKVFDGGSSVCSDPINGVTTSGRPYFVMELVKGTRITDFCDQNQLTPRQRLELFLSVCHAVQHAHNKGIIHRDLKPSNVLVSRHDTTPVVKVIDFGVAKALGQELTDKTFFTGVMQMVGTPLYMSPEQAGMSDLDIDTRSDIYTLGVLLYELLTGTTPFDKERFKHAGYEEIRRIIREEEPPKPSTRLSDLSTPRALREAGVRGEGSVTRSVTSALAFVAAQRQTEPAKLTKLVKGELDWIVMKALDKDRNRRYETASAFAMDLQRFLADEPVQACPPSAAYRLRKFARRNQGRLLAACVVGVALMLAVGGIGWAVRDRAAHEADIAKERSARQVKAANDLELALDRAELFQGQGKRADALAAIEHAELLVHDAAVDAARSRRLTAVKERLAAEDRDQRFVAGYDEVRVRVISRVDVAKNRFTPEAAYPEIRELLRQFGITFGAAAPDRAASQILGRPEPVRQLLVAAIYDCSNDAPKQDPQSWKWLRAVLEAVDNDPWRMAVRKEMSDRNWKAVERLVLEVDIHKHPPSLLLFIDSNLPAELKSLRLNLLHKIHRAYPGDLWANISLASELIDHGGHAEAIRYLTAALALRPDNPGIYLNRGNCLVAVGEVEAAIADYQRCLTLAPRYVTALANLAGLFGKQGKPEDAVAVCNQAIEMEPTFAAAWAQRGLAHLKLNQFAKSVADNTKAIELDTKLAEAWSNRGEAYRLLRQFDKAIADCTQAITLDANQASAWANRGDCYLQLGKYQKAVADCSRAIELDKTNVLAWYVRGGARGAMGDQVKAIADCTTAVKLGPRSAWAHYNLGIVLANHDRAKEAIAAYRKALEIDDSLAEAHCNLGGIFERQGEFREALKEMRRGHELGSRDPSWPYPSIQWVRELERLVELDERLPDLITEKTTAASPMERIELARLCSIKQLNRAAVRFYEEAFAAAPKLADDLGAANRYNAACAAALAGCGHGKDADQLDEKEIVRLRRQALTWLRADLAAQRSLLEKDAAKVGPALRSRMQHWLADPDFKGVRGPKALAMLPEAERSEWQRFWMDVAEASRE